jgi:uncharacterized protein
MSQMNLRNSLSVILLFLAALNAFAFQQVPTLTARVTDLTGTLTEQQKNSLENELEAYENEKGSQIVVLLVPTTDPYPIENYSIRVAEDWKIGREGVDDGIIMVIAKEDRKIRIEVGYGLEGALPDAYSKRIIENIIIPNFRQGDFYNGIEDGLGAIMSLIQGEDLPAITQEPSGTSAIMNESFFITILMITLIILSVLKAFIKKSKFKWVAGGITGVVVGLIFGSLIFGGIGILVSLFILFSTTTTGSGGRYYGGGFSGGGGSSFGGGGFSGGGGSFGGGGASGGW